MNIRKASLADSPDLHRLSFHLGYQPQIENLKASLERMLNNPDYEVVVICEGDAVRGWMTLLKRHRIEDVDFLQVAAVVVDEAYQGKGLGRQLLNFAQSRAQELKLAFVGLHSSKRREKTHKFYEGLGFEKLKESFFFKKETSRS